MDMKHYTDGKSRTEIDRVKELEHIYGIDQVSPFGTLHTEVFKEIVEKRDGREEDPPHERDYKTLVRLNNLATKAGALISADLAEQKKFLWEAFRSYQIKNPPNYSQHKGQEMKLDMRKKENRKIMKDLDYARTKSVFEKDFPTDTPESFRKLLNTFTLADLQNLAAQAGFNPTFDRRRAVDTLVTAFTEDWRSRP